MISILFIKCNFLFYLIYFLCSIILIQAHSLIWKKQCSCYYYITLQSNIEYHNWNISFFYPKLFFILVRLSNILLGNLSVLSFSCMTLISMHLLRQNLIEELKQPHSTTSLVPVKVYKKTNWEINKKSSQN